jgi:hypothetical protein
MKQRGDAAAIGDAAMPPPSSMIPKGGKRLSEKIMQNDTFERGWVMPTGSSRRGCV